MRKFTAIGLVLIVLGAAALLFGHFSYTETKPALKAGPIQVNTEEEHSISVPTIAGIVVVVAGLGLILAGRRTA